MTLPDLKKEIAELEPEVQDEIVAFIGHLRMQRLSTYEQEMERRLDDRNPESWVRLEDLEAELSGN